MPSGLGDKVSLFPTVNLNQFDWHTELFISLLPGEGKEDKVQHCRAKSGFILIILIFSDGERRKRIRILSGRERFKVNLIGNIWNATYLRPFQIAPHSLHSEWNDSFQRQGHQGIMAAITYSYTTLHSVAYLAGILTSLSSQMPCQRGKIGTERALSGQFEGRVCGEANLTCGMQVIYASTACLPSTYRARHFPKTIRYLRTHLYNPQF